MKQKSNKLIHKKENFDKYRIPAFEQIKKKKKPYCKKTTYISLRKPTNSKKK